MTGFILLAIFIALVAFVFWPGWPMYAQQGDGT